MGSSVPGIPLIFNGRTQSVSWGVTSSATDETDLYREKLNEDGTKYNLNGDWKSIDIERYILSVKGISEPVTYDVKYTHRGPLLDGKLLQNVQLLSGNQMPIHENFGDFSLAWSGHYIGESWFDVIDLLMNSDDLLQIKDGISSIGKYVSIPINVVLADTSGNIGFTLLSSAPVRSNEYPYLGCRVLDGTISTYDWQDIIDVDLLPFMLNPSKGYFVTANNRVVPENSKYDIGATAPSSGRAQRLLELIE